MKTMLTVITLICLAGMAGAFLIRDYYAGEEYLVRMRERSVTEAIGVKPPLTLPLRMKISDFLGTIPGTVDLLKERFRRQPGKISAAAPKAGPAGPRPAEKPFAAAGPGAAPAVTPAPRPAPQPVTPVEIPNDYAATGTGALRNVITLPADLPESVRDAVLEHMGDPRPRPAVMTFGSWPREKGGKKEPIEWLAVKTVTVYNVFLVSKEVLDRQPFNDKGKASWTDSSLRRWLNNDFLNAAFSPEEKKRILTGSVAVGNGAVSDRVFIPCREEALILLSDPRDKTAAPTGYALSPDMPVDSISGGAPWWIRGQGGAKCELISHMGFVGEVNDQSLTMVGVRPALWITTKNPEDLP